MSLPPWLDSLAKDPVMKSKRMADVFDLVMLYDSMEPAAIKENIQRHLIRERDNVPLVSCCQPWKMSATLAALSLSLMYGIIIIVMTIRNGPWMWKGEAWRSPTSVSS